jgi:hypothetical protein
MMRRRRTAWRDEEDEDEAEEARQDEEGERQDEEEEGRDSEGERRRRGEMATMGRRCSMTTRTRRRGQPHREGGKEAEKRPDDERGRAGCSAPIYYTCHVSRHKPKEEYAPWGINSMF